MKRLLLGFGLAAGAAYAVRDRLAAPLPQPSWDETDNDPEDLSADLAQRAREAEGAQASEESPATERRLEQRLHEPQVLDERGELPLALLRVAAKDRRGVD